MPVALATESNCRGTASGGISWIIIYVGDRLYIVTGSSPVGRANQKPNDSDDNLGHSIFLLTICAYYDIIFSRWYNMDFIKFVEQIPNITIAKRVASAYVADYRRLELDEIKAFLKKTAKQYTSFENISNRLEEIILDPNRAVRIIAPILLRDYLLNQDDFISSTKDTDSAVLNYEKSIVDESNNFDESKISKDFALFKHMLDAAWAYNDDISVDEKNLLET